MGFKPWILAQIDWVGVIKWAFRFGPHKLSFDPQHSSWASTSYLLPSYLLTIHIDLIIYESTGDWRLTGYYGFPERYRRRASWILLFALAIRSSLSWVCIGDFNDILSPSDKNGGVAHHDWLFRGFHGALTDCSLNELFLHGYGFTWERSKGSPHWVQEKLD